MARTLRETPLTTANARSKLDAGTYWRGIDPATHLGYRKQRRGGRWIVRWYTGSGAYQQETIGTADDALDADGAVTLTYVQAERCAREIVHQRRAETAARAAGQPVTLRTAIEEYLSEREDRERKARGEGEDRYLKRDARSRLRKHVLDDVPGIADKLLSVLSERDLMEWREALRLTSSTEQRLINDLRAALNRAVQRHRSRLPAETVAVIKNGLASKELAGGAARDAQVLTDAHVRDLLRAAKEFDSNDGWNGDLYRLVIVLAATGARFSQVTRMTVSDVQPDQGRLMIPVSRKGRGTKAATRIGVRVGEDVLTVLSPIVVGRKGLEPLFLRPRWRQTSPTQWEVVGREPWHSTSELTSGSKPWSKIVERAKLPPSIIPYALRHSSIVRCIRASLPIRLVAALHDTSTAMIERHYSAYIVSALDDLAAKAIVPLAPTDAGVIRLPSRAS